MSPLVNDNPRCLRCGRHASEARLVLTSLTAGDMTREIRNDLVHRFGHDPIVDVRIERLVTSDNEALDPPRWAVLALHFLLPHRDRRAIIGDLVEEYAEIYGNCGRFAATAWLWWQATRSSIRLGVIAWLVGRVKRLIP
jgi:hypothetical protein